MEMMAKIQDVFRSVFDDPTIQIDAASSPDTIADWDSFANIQLIAAIEEAFGVKFTVEEAVEIHSVADILRKVAPSPAG